jgi:hypothetical protein
MTLESYTMAVVTLAKVYLKNEGITGVCRDTIATSFSSGIGIDEAARLVVDDSLLWEGRVS